MLCRDLLADSGTIFVQISDENLHHVREVMDEVFEPSNMVMLIPFRKKTMPLGAKTLEGMCDYLLWYARSVDAVRYRQLYRKLDVEGEFHWAWYEHADGTRKKMTADELADHSLLPSGARVFRLVSMWPPTFSANSVFPLRFRGHTFEPPPGQCWPTSEEGMQRLVGANRLESEGRNLRYVLYLDDYPLTKLTNLWVDTIGARDQRYVVETSPEVAQRCILMTTERGDLVLDPTCGSGTTAYVAEQWGRRWITCDTSRVALALARQRLMTATFPYYKLARPVAAMSSSPVAGGDTGATAKQGVAGGFVYKTVPHVTLRSIAQNEPPEQEILYDQPEMDRSKVRVSGPLTVEAIPVPAMESVGEPSGLPREAEAGGQSPPLPPDARSDDIARRGRGEGRIANPAADHITTMIELLRKAGVNFPGGKKLVLENLRPLGVGWLHAEAESVAAMSSSPKIAGGDTGATAQRAVRERPNKVAVSFGPRHGPVTAIQTHEAAQTASVNGYDVLVLAGFSVDPEAQAFIQKTPIKNLTIHFANVNPDVLVGDLLKTSRASQLFTVFGSPDAVVRPANVETPRRGVSTNEYVVELRGVDIYDPNTGELHQSRGEDVAAWFLDQDYDGYTFCISQAFFPANADAWEKLERALKGTLDPEKFEALRGTVSLPFQPGKHNRIAVKVIDMRGNEVIRVINAVGERGER